MPRKGYKQSEEHKAKLRKYLKNFKKGSDPRRRSGPHSAEAKAKMALVWKDANRAMVFKRGAESHMWRGGITPIHAKIRYSKESRDWRKRVLERDNYACVFCGATKDTATIHVDHIKPFAYFPELRFEDSNGRVLCKPCHLKTDTYGRKFKLEVMGVLDHTLA